MKYFKKFEEPIAPKFPDRIFNILNYGAEEGGKKKVTDAIRAAIEDCAGQGGGTVLIPKGNWLTGPIHLRDNVNLHLEKDALVEFSEEFGDYLPVVYGILGGVRVYSVSHFIYAYKCHNIAVTGEGVFDGHGHVWMYMKKHQPGMEDLMRKGRAGAPMSERVYDKPEDGVRPRMLQFVECENVLLEGVQIQNSPSWNVHFAWCKNITVRNVKIDNPFESHNTDGINFEYCKRGLMEDCTIAGGDDMCCIKAGREKDAWDYGAPCEDIEIRNCHAIKCRCGGVTIGSETSASIRNIYIHDCYLEQVSCGVNLKTMKGRGGVVENIDVENIKVDYAVREAIRVSLKYDGEPLDDQTQPSINIPVVRNIHVNNYVCKRTKNALDISGIKGAELENISISNSVIYSEKTAHIENAQLSLDNVRFLQNLD